MAFFFVVFCVQRFICRAGIFPPNGIKCHARKVFHIRASVDVADMALRCLRYEKPIRTAFVFGKWESI